MTTNSSSVMSTQELFEILSEDSPKKSKQELLKLLFDDPTSATPQNASDILVEENSVKDPHKPDCSESHPGGKGSEDNDAFMNSSNKSDAEAKIGHWFIASLIAMIKVLEQSQGQLRLEFGNVRIIRVCDNTDNILVSEMNNLKIDGNSNGVNAIDTITEKVSEENEGVVAKSREIPKVVLDPRVSQVSPQKPMTSYMRTVAARHPAQKPTDRFTSTVAARHPAQEPTYSFTSTVAARHPAQKLTDSSTSSVTARHHSQKAMTSSTRRHSVQHIDSSSKRLCQRQYHTQSQLPSSSSQAVMNPTTYLFNPPPPRSDESFRFMSCPMSLPLRASPKSFPNPNGGNQDPVPQINSNHSWISQSRNQKKNHPTIRPYWSPTLPEH